EDVRTRGAERHPVLVLDVVAVRAVVADDEGGQRLACARVLPRRPVGAPLEPVAQHLAQASPALARQHAHHEAMDLVDDRAAYLDRVILLGHRPEIGEMIGREINPADERDLAVDDDDLAVHAAEQVAPQAEDLRLRIEQMHAHADLGERRKERWREVGRTVTVDGDVDLDAAAGDLDEHPMQLDADLVLEQDEGLDQHLASRRGDRLEHAREILLAVLEQASLVAADPDGLHSTNSAASGAWSDSRDHGCGRNITGRAERTLRT